MSKIYLADSTDYVVAEGFDEATDKFIEVRGKDPETLSLFKEEGLVVNASEMLDIAVTIGPEAAEADGATTSPSGNVYLQVGDYITLTATPSAGYPVFNYWGNSSGDQLSTDNPYNHIVVAGETEIKAVFST